MTRNSSKASSDTPRLLQAWCHSSQCPTEHTLHLLPPAQTSIGSLPCLQQPPATPSAHKALVLQCDGRGGGGCRALSGTAVDDPPLTHTRAGMMWQGQKEVNHPSMGSGWHARIGTSLGMKVPRGSGVIQWVPWAMMGMAVNECAVQHVSRMLVKYTSSEC